MGRLEDDLNDYEAEQASDQQAYETLERYNFCRTFLADPSCCPHCGDYWGDGFLTADRVLMCMPNCTPDATDWRQYLKDVDEKILRSCLCDGEEFEDINYGGQQ